MSGRLAMVTSNARNRKHSCFPIAKSRSGRAIVSAVGTRQRWAAPWSPLVLTNTRGIDFPRRNLGDNVPSDESNGWRLAVIMAADVASYSRLMSGDEEATLSSLAGYQEVIAARLQNITGASSTRPAIAG